MILKFEDYTKLRLEEDVWQFRDYYKLWSSNTIGTNDQVDAFRTAYKMAYVAYNYGDKVSEKLFYDTLKSDPEYNNETLREMGMKIWNARVGREIAKDLKQRTKGGDYTDAQIKSFLGYLIVEKMNEDKMIMSLQDNKNYDDFDDVYYDKKVEENKNVDDTDKDSVESDSSEPSEYVLEGGVSETVILNDSKETSDTQKVIQQVQTPCVGSYHVSGYTRADGTEVKDYIRTCGAKHVVEKEVTVKTEKSSTDNEAKNKTKKTEGNKVESKDTTTVPTSYTPVLEGGINTSPLEEAMRNPLLRLLNLLTNSDKKTPWEMTQEVIYTNAKFLPLASNSTKNAMNNLSVARKDKNAIVFENVNEIPDEKLKEKLKSLSIPENTKGVQYNINSKTSKKMSKTNEIQEYINEFRKGNIQNSIEFTSDLDAYLFVQHATIYDPKISNDVFTCKIVDFSDFVKRLPDSLKSIFTSTLNNWGYNMQEKGYYENYFIIIDIIVDLKKK